MDAVTSVTRTVIQHQQMAGHQPHMMCRGAALAGATGATTRVVATRVAARALVIFFFMAELLDSRGQHRIGGTVARVGGRDVPATRGVCGPGGYNFANVNRSGPSTFVQTIYDLS